MISSEISIGGMTPEIPSKTLPVQNQVSRKMSKASIMKSEDLSMLSPPLSPYVSCGESSSISLNNKILKEVQLKQISKLIENKQVETFINISRKTNLKEFPIDNYENFPLVVNAWADVGTKGFRKLQLNFIKQYTSRTKVLNVSKAALPHVRKYTQKRIVKSFYNNNSDSDYNLQFEKIRTRRLVKESPLQTKSSTEFDITTVPLKVSTCASKKRKSTITSSPSTPSHIDWKSIPDFSPDVSQLPNNTRCLKVEWKGQPMSLADDPLISNLHPAEVTLASILRLPCNLYLDSKRRLFVEKVARLKKGLPFRRTDAQKSCRIDVNKASRLFAAYEKIGWLEDKNFEKFM